VTTWFYTFVNLFTNEKFMSLETGDKNSAYHFKKLIGKNESLNQVIELNDENRTKLINCIAIRALQSSAFAT